MHDVWIVIGNANNWGKAEYLKDAIANCLKNGPRMTHAHFYEFQNVENLKEVYVDEMGTVHYPLNAKMKKLANVELPKALVKAFTAFDLEVEELRYGPTFEIFDTAGDDE